MSASAAALRVLATNCRTLATRMDMENVAAALNEMAFDYDRQAERADEAEARTRILLAARGAAGGAPLSD